MEEEMNKIDIVNELSQKISLNQKVAKVVEGLFGGYDTGLDPARPLPFTTFRKDEVLPGCGHE